MRKFAAAALLTGMLGTPFGIAVSHAQPTPAPPRDTVGLLDENVVRARLQQQGYTQLSDFRRDADTDTYVVAAVKDGRRVQLTIDARTGAVQERAAR